MTETTSPTLLPYKFSIFYKAIIHFYQNEDKIPDDVNFYSKQHFTAYLSTNTRAKLNDSYDHLFSLANNALHDDPFDLLSDGEYVYDNQSDDFVCFIENIETNAWWYLQDKEVVYNYDGSTTLSFANWD